MYLSNRKLLAGGAIAIFVFALVAISAKSHNPGSGQTRDEVENDAAAVQRAMQAHQQDSRFAQDIAAQLDLKGLNADEYRQEIVGIDRLIFDPQAMDQSRRQDLETALEALAGRVKSSSDSRFIQIEALELRKLANYANGKPPDWLQNQWMRIRNNLFDDRSWFARSAADLERQPEPPPSESDANAPALARTAAESPSPAPAPLTRSELQGRWRVREISGNGKPMADPELSDSMWTFEADQLVIDGPGGAPNVYRYTKLNDDQGESLRLESRSSGTNPAEHGWMIYEFSERELRVAFYDGLGARPASFTPVKGKADPLLIVVTLERTR